MNILKFKDCSYKNKHLVGGKCSSLGELYHLSQQLNFNIADGFAVTTYLYDKFVEQNNLSDFIENTLNSIDYSNIKDIEDKSVANNILIQKFDMMIRYLGLTNSINL